MFTANSFDPNSVSMGAQYSMASVPPNMQDVPVMKQDDQDEDQGGSTILKNTKKDTKKTNTKTIKTSENLVTAGNWGDWLPKDNKWKMRKDNNKLACGAQV